MYKSLNSKLVLIFIVFMISVMTTVGIFLMNGVFGFYTDEFSTNIDEGFAGTVTEQLTSALKYEDSALAQKQLLSAYANVFGFDRGRNFYILDKDANILASSEDETKSLALTPNLVSAMNGKTSAKQSYGTDFLDYAKYITDGENECIIYIKDNLKEMKNLSFMQFSIIIQSLLVGLVIALIMAFFLARAITNPIKSVTSSTVQIADGKYDHRLRLRSRDEIGTLARNFNTMAQIIQNTLGEVSGEKEKLKNVFDSLEAGVAAFDENGNLLHINPSALSMLSLPDNASPDFNELTAALGTPEITMKILKTSGQLHIEEQALSEVKNRELVVRIDFGVFGYDGTARAGFIVVFQNITESALLEKNRREFIANVSHELRTPLTSIKGATETVLMDDEMPESIRKRFLGMVMSESDRMTRIVQDLLVLSRLDNRRMSWKPTKFDIVETVNHMCTVLKSEAAAHSHNLTFDSKISSALRIYADKERIEQVVANIIGNAVKYTPDGGSIRVEVARSGADEVKISVADSGVGISEDDLEHIFERFYRVDKSRSTDAGGTGLGLAIAKDIVDAHGGNITAESELGKGTTVYITLPIDSRVGSDRQE